MDAKDEALMNAHVSLAVQRALEERAQQKKRSKAERERLEALEGELHEAAWENYYLTAKQPTPEEFQALWADGLRDEVIREHLAIEQVKKDLRQRGSYSF